MKPDPRVKCCPLSAPYVSCHSRCQVELPRPECDWGRVAAAVPLPGLGSLNVNVSTCTRNTYTWVDCSFLSRPGGLEGVCWRTEWGPRREAGFTVVLTSLPSAQVGSWRWVTCAPAWREVCPPYFDFVWMDLLKDAGCLGKMNSVLRSVLLSIRSPAFSWWCFGF